jgi:small subunit ribosomal protein S20
MAHHQSAKKRIRQTTRRTEINRSRVSRIRTYVKKFDAALASGDKAAAEAALREAVPELQRGVTRGVLHRNTVSRKISRMSARVKALG